MSTNTQAKDLGTIIGYVSVVDAKGVQSLLAKYHLLPENAKVNDLIEATIIGLGSEKFAGEYMTLANKNLKGVYKGGEGVSADAIISSGTNLISSILNSKAAKQQAELQAKLISEQTAAQQQQAESQLEIQRLKLQTAQAEANKPQESKTLLYAGIGFAGLLVMGVLIFAITKKK